MRLHLRLILTVLLAGFAALVAAGPAAAHVVPSTVLQLDVHEDDITVEMTLPTTDLVTASGIDVPVDGTVPAAAAEQLAAYVEEHFDVTIAAASDATSATGTWNVDVGDVATAEVEQWGTGAFDAVTATATLTPPAGADLRSFTLDYDAILHQVVTADVFVLLRSDSSTGEVEQTRSLGAITLDTVTGTVSPLTVDLAGGSARQGFTGMLLLGISHIAEGTDHQLFLLTLLLPAPLLAASLAGDRAGRSRHWREVAPTRRAVRRITTTTIAFTIGHSLTLALGALGLPVPQQPVEAAIAVSILIAAAHAVRPLFPGREPLIAALFGLVHGMAFSTTLSEMELSGTQLVLSLLGFNLGIELMQLVVVLLVLPPLIVLARTPAYRPLRTTAAVVTAVAAVGWLLDRVGVPTPLSTAADSLGSVSPWIAATLWIAAALVLLGTRGRRSGIRRVVSA
ncbi:HupE/UreJ family protein [Kineococcus arenarius]|uniref:HupE/UreJ family protein n=1 Tax=Kineococcus sp. SYSU DK007 TaxID=3383128 RepID=UPI003D7D4C59